MMRPIGVVSKKDCGVWSLLVRRLWCSFLAAPMFPMARVKEDTMTRRPEVGGGRSGGEGAGWTRGRRSWRKRFNINMRGEKKRNGVTGRQRDRASSPGWRNGHLEGKVITTTLIHTHLMHSRQVCTGSLHPSKVRFVGICTGKLNTLVPPSMRVQARRNKISFWRMDIQSKA